jgi:hypothetical protein
MRTIRTPKKRHAFLAAIAAGNSVSAACRAAGLGRSAAYSWRDDDGDFAGAWDEAIECGTERLEDEAIRRALESSDTMLIFMLKARKPAVYREPRAAIMAMSSSPEEMRSLVEESRRLRELPTEQIEAELAEMQRRRQLANEAPGNVLHKTNGAAGPPARALPGRRPAVRNDRGPAPKL